MFHKFQSVKADGADSTLVKASNWNDNHFFSPNAKSANYTATATDDYIPVTTGSSTISITLPTATSGQLIFIKKIDNGSGKVTIIGTIDGAVNKNLNFQFAHVLLMGNGTSWDVLASSAKVASGTAALGTTLIASGAKASIVTVSAPGVLATDTITADFNADPSAVTGYAPSASGMLTIIKFPTADNVNFYVYNNTASSITPGAITLNWRVVR